MILTFENLINNIFVKIDDFYKNISPLINKQYFIENSNGINNKKRIYKYRIDTLSEEDKRLLKKRNLIETVIGEIKRLTNITTTRIIKNVYNYFINVLSSKLAYQIKVRMKLG